MSCTVKVACIQVPANDWKDAPTAWLFLKELIHAAAKEHDLVIVPESAYPAYFLSRHEAADVAPVSLILDQVSDIARASGSYIAFGYADGFANAATLFARDGMEIARKEKSYLWHFDHRWFTPGEEVMIADTEFGRVALVVCADARLTELVRVVRFGRGDTRRRGPEGRGVLDACRERRQISARPLQRRYPVGCP